MKQDVKMLACDFETTVYEGQTSTEVWSSAYIEIGTEGAKPEIKVSIIETLKAWRNAYKGKKLVGYYHNLKFDGSFWIDWLLRHGYKFVKEKTEDLKESQFTAIISDLGAWYTLSFNFEGLIVELRDSLKLIPLTLKKAGKAFKTKHQKLEMEYEGKRYSGCKITDDEKKYIENDVYVLKECLEYMFSQKHSKLTIGACCLSEFKKWYTKEQYEKLFPDLTDVYLNEFIYGAKTADEYVRKSYHGGWCYVVPEKANKICGKGLTADVNSLYPSMMSSESGNAYPVGKPEFWHGNYIPDVAKKASRYYFVTFRCSFRIKKDMLPFVQIKSSPFYSSTEMLLDSIPMYKGKKYKKLKLSDGHCVTDVVTMTMTQTDFELFKKHYEITELEILHGCYFWDEIGLFDAYINKYRKIKQQSKDGMRQIAKLFLNNLYGKFAASDCSSYQIPVLDENGNVKFELIEEHRKKVGYIPIGSAITSYARNFTISAAQANYYGTNKKGFIYADTDSIHCDIAPEEVKAIKVDEKAFCCWKLESYWDEGIFVRQKTYIEHVTHEDGEPVKKPYYNIKCAGMNDICKNKFDKELEENKVNLTDFKQGLEIYGKLRPVRIKGGIVLEDTTYKIR